jgi:hypothetical protein
VKKSVEDVFKKDKSLTTEEIIKQHKIKENLDNKDLIENKIKSYEENIIILQNSIDGDLSKTNLRNTRIKEIKLAKGALEIKLNTVEEQIKNLLNDENKKKTFNVKVYLDNFEKDRQDAIKVVKQLETKKLKKVENNNNYLAAIRYNSKDEEMNDKRKEEYFSKLNKLKERNEKYHEEITILKEELKSKIISDGKYHYQTVEQEFKRKMEKIDNERKNYEKQESIKRKKLFYPIRKSQIEVFSKKVSEDRNKLLAEMENNRLSRIDEIAINNKSLPKQDTRIAENVKSQDKELKELSSRINFEKQISYHKTKQYSKNILKTKLPNIDEDKKREMEILRNSLGNQKVKPHKRKHKRILIIKRNSVNIDSETETDLDIPNPVKREPRQPLKIRPDYLTEMRTKRSLDKSLERSRSSSIEWDRLINNNKYTLLQNVEDIKIKADLLESHAKMNQKYIQHNGGLEKNIKLSEEMSNKMIESIKAKLTILEKIR